MREVCADARQQIWKNEPKFVFLVDGKEYIKKSKEIELITNQSQSHNSQHQPNTNQLQVTHSQKQSQQTNKRLAVSSSSESSDSNSSCDSEQPTTKKSKTTIGEPYIQQQPISSILFDSSANQNNLSIINSPYCMIPAPSASRNSISPSLIKRALFSSPNQSSNTYNTCANTQPSSLCASLKETTNVIQANAYLDEDSKDYFE